MSGIIVPTLIIIGILPVFLCFTFEHGNVSVLCRFVFVPIRIGGERRGKSWKKDSENKLKRFLSRSDRKILFKNAYTTLKRLMPRIYIPYLKLHILAAAKDPSNAAVMYGTAGMLLERVYTAICPRVKKPDLHADVDFQKERMELAVCARVRLCLYQVLWAGFDFGWGVWRDHRTMHKRSMNTYDKSAPWRHDGRYHGQDPDDGRGQYRNRNTNHNH